MASEENVCKGDSGWNEQRTSSTNIMCVFVPLKSRQFFFGSSEDHSLISLGLAGKDDVDGLQSEIHWLGPFFILIDSWHVECYKYLLNYAHSISHPHHGYMKNKANTSKIQRPRGETMKLELAAMAFGPTVPSSRKSLPGRSPYV